MGETITTRLKRGDQIWHLRPNPRNPNSGDIVFGPAVITSVIVRVVPSGQYEWYGGEGLPLGGLIDHCCFTSREDAEMEKKKRDLLLIRELSENVPANSILASKMGARSRIIIPPNANPFDDPWADSLEYAENNQRDGQYSNKDKPEG